MKQSMSGEPVVQIQKNPDVDFSNSKNFYNGSPQFVNDRRSIGFAAGFRCSQCALKSRQPHSQVAYCYVHKRIVDLSETCPRNTRNNGYRNVNMRN
jgi:hypothetical protein